MQKKRLMSQNDDKKTDRDKLFAEQRAIKDSIKGPANLQVRLSWCTHTQRCCLAASAMCCCVFTLPNPAHGNGCPC